MKEIPLGHNRIALVDDGDYERLARYRWNTVKGSKTFYARRTVWTEGKCRTVLMHREILGLTDTSAQGDHRDLNGLNNQRDNLRSATSVENNRNKRVRTDNTSGYKGVSWHKDAKKWRVQIAVQGKIRDLGFYGTVEDAAYAYAIAVKNLHGEFARVA